eukprot:g15409.t1
MNRSRSCALGSSAATSTIAASSRGNKIVRQDPYLGRNVRCTDKKRYSDLFLAAQARNKSVEDSGAVRQYSTASVSAQFLQYPVITIEVDPAVSPTALAQFNDRGEALQKSLNQKRVRVYRKDPFLGRDVRKTDMRSYVEVFAECREKNRQTLGLRAPASVGAVDKTISTATNASSCVDFFGGAARVWRSSTMLSSAASGAEEHQLLQQSQLESGIVKASSISKGGTKPKTKTREHTTLLQMDSTDKIFTSPLVSKQPDDVVKVNDDDAQGQVGVEEKSSQSLQVGGGKQQRKRELATSSTPRTLEVVKLEDQDHQVDEVEEDDDDGWVVLDLCSEFDFEPVNDGAPGLESERLAMLCEDIDAGKTSRDGALNLRTTESGTRDRMSKQGSLVDDQRPADENIVYHTLVKATAGATPTALASTSTLTATAAPPAAALEEHTDITPHFGAATSFAGNCSVTMEAAAVDHAAAPLSVRQHFQSHTAQLLTQYGVMGAADRLRREPAAGTLVLPQTDVMNRGAGGGQVEDNYLDVTPCVRRSDNEDINAEPGTAVNKDQTAARTGCLDAVAPGVEVVNSMNILLPSTYANGTRFASPPGSPTHDKSAQTVSVPPPKHKLLPATASEIEYLRELNEEATVLIQHIVNREQSSKDRLLS